MTQRTPYKDRSTKTPSGHIHLRCGDLERKGRYNLAAQTAGLTLAAWMFRICDKASGYKPKTKPTTKP